jgi:hypothetical protein
MLTRRQRRRADQLTSSTRGEGGIRTPDAGITDVTVFETAAFNHSATSPRQSVSTGTPPFNHIHPSTLISHNPISQHPVYIFAPERLTSYPRFSIHDSDKGL